MSLRDDARCGRALAGTAGGPLSAALLGKDRRYAPDRRFDTLHVRLELDVDPRARSVAGVCTTTVKAIADGVRRLEFGAGGMRVTGVWAGERRLRHVHAGERLTVTLPRALAPGQDATVSVRYRLSDPRRGFHFVGPGRESASAPAQAWSQGQPEDAHWWFPCHDSPHEKATTEVLARVPAGFTAVSNGVLLARRREGARELFHWRMNHPHALYLVSLAVGRFGEVQEKWEDVPVVFYCERGREDDARRGFSKTAAALALFSKRFGVRYPYERYAQVAVREFPGGMENTTCTTQTDACLLSAEAALDTDLDLLVAHELAHQWFGDLVTCRDWSHAWLNEGFATYSEYVFTEHDKGVDEADREWELNRRAYLDEDAHRYRRPIVCATFKEPWVVFDRHLYEKGGWVLHMLRRELGEEAWWRAVQHYLRRFRDQSVETADLVTAVEHATGRNVRAFFDQWVYGAGYPALETRWGWDAAGGRASVRVRQTQSEAFRFPLTVRFTGAGGRWTREFTETLKEKDRTLSWRLPGAPALVEVDPAHVLLKKLDERKPVALWRAQLDRARSGQSRSEAARALARWGDTAAVRALETAARRDPFWGTAAEAAAALGSTRSDAARRALERLLEVERPKVRRAAAGALAGWADARSAGLLKGLARRDPSLHVRAEALRGLGRAKDPALLAELRAALKRPSYWDLVAGGALQGLSLSREPRALPDLLKAARATTAYPLRAHALRALGTWHELEPAVVDTLTAALESRDARVAMAAIGALGETRDARAVKPLEAVRDGSPDTRLRTFAREALSRIQGEGDKE